MRISDWSSDVCSSDLGFGGGFGDRSGGGFGGDRGGFGGGARGGAGAGGGRGMPAQVVGEGKGIVKFFNGQKGFGRSEEHTSELQSLMRISYAVFCLKKKKTHLHPMSHEMHITTNILII